MKFEDAREGMLVRITAGDPAHPLHGWPAEITVASPALPLIPPRTWPEIADLRTDDGQAFRPDDWESPFAFPHGKLLLWLGEKPARPWAFPYITAGPDDVEPYGKGS